MAFWELKKKEKSYKCAQCGEEFSSDFQREQHEVRCQALSRAQKTFERIGRTGLVMVDWEYNFNDDELLSAALFCAEDDQSFLACRLTNMILKECRTSGVSFVFEVDCLTVADTDDLDYEPNAKLEVEMTAPEFVAFVASLEKGVWQVEIDDTVVIRSLSVDERQQFLDAVRRIKSTVESILEEFGAREAGATDPTI